MFVVRPQNILSTPRQLARDLGCETRFYPNHRRDRTFNFNRDFFMTPVAPQDVQNAPEDYVYTYQFATRNKYGQRQSLIQAGIPTPAVANTAAQANALRGDHFVVRPLRHSRGVGYRVTTDRSDFREGSEYISELYAKRREYRVIYVFGQPVVVIRKKPNEGVGADQPWGHVNSRFQTINDVPGSRLAQTNAIERLAEYPVIRGAHIVAADILFNGSRDQPYVVLELNFCPALDIDNNRTTVVQCIQNRNRGRQPTQAPVVRPNPRLAEITGLLAGIAARQTALLAEGDRLDELVRAVDREFEALSERRDNLEREQAALR